MIRIHIKWVVLLLVGFPLFSCEDKQNQDEPTAEKPVMSATENYVRLTAQQYQLADLKVGKIEQRKLSRFIQVNGLLDVPPQNLVSISTPMGGFLKSTHLLPGTHVKQGQIIAVMEHPDYIQLQQDYLDSKSRLQFAALEYERQQELSRENVNSAKVFQQSTADYQVLQHRVKALAEKLILIGLDPKRLTSDGISRAIPIYCPIDGYVKEVNVNLGKFVNPTDVLFEIVNTSHMHLALSVFEKDIPQIKIDQTVTFYLPNEPQKERKGVVHLVGKAIGADKTVMVHVHLNQDDPSLLPGMYVNARVATGDSTGYVLPNNAIVNSEGKDYIFIVKQGQAHEYEKVAVTKGISEQGYTAIRLPPQVHPESAQVVVGGAYNLLATMMNTEQEE